MTIKTGHRQKKKKLRKKEARRNEGTKKEEKFMALKETDKVFMSDDTFIGFLLP